MHWSKQEHLCIDNGYFIFLQTSEFAVLLKSQMIVTEICTKTQICVFHLLPKIILDCQKLHSLLFFFELRRGISQLRFYDQPTKNIILIHQFLVDSL